jgi:two-component sensor histidine kinase
MAFHELATNASKYGALSVEGGNVEVNWWIFDRGQGATLQLEWKEKGGPAAKEPSKRGFGSSLIISSIEKTLNGRIEREYGPDGFSCVATLPLNELYTERDREHAREGTFKDPFS